MHGTPMPRITDLSRPFWDGCNEGRLVIQHCTAADCERYVFYPRVACPHCHRDTLEWRDVSGRGTVVSHTTVHRPHHVSFDPLVPYVFAAVALKEGPILYARLRGVDAAPENLMSRPAKAVFEPYTDRQELLLFELEDSLDALGF
jgi:uncharacterized OB-fold protein